MRKIGVYVRVSTSEQDNDNQLAVLQGRFGSEIVGIYEDVASGKNLDRPDWNRLMADCKAGYVDTIAVVKIDRIARSLYAFVNLTKELELLGISIYSLDVGLIDYSNPATRVMVSMLATFAEFERNLIVERTNAGLDNARRKGVKLGRPSFEYPIHTAAIARLEGRTWREVATITSIPYSTVRGRLRYQIVTEMEKIKSEQNQKGEDANVQ